MRNVLIITDKEEQYYYAPFMEACEEMGNPANIFLFFWSEFPRRRTASVSLTADNILRGVLEVYDCIRKVDCLLDIEKVDVAWHLRTRAPKREEFSIPDVEFEFVKEESRAALESIFSCMDCVWINPRHITKFIGLNKLYQQKVARQCGLATPSTLISRDADKIVEFLPKDDHLLVKMIGVAGICDQDGRPLFVYSNLVPKDLFREKAALVNSCPVFVQGYVRKKYEYRVMIIGDEVLACRIDSQTSVKTSIDWRHYDMVNVEHVRADLPQEINARLGLFMRSVGLKYGAVDMIETPEGEYVFLEVNHSGQWDWINTYAKLEIPHAVIRMLANA